MLKDEVFRCLGNAINRFLYSQARDRPGFNRGKGLGGSSNINMQSWLHPGREEINGIYYS